MHFYLGNGICTFFTHFLHFSVFYVNFLWKFLVGVELFLNGSHFNWALQYFMGLISMCRKSESPIMGPTHPIWRLAMPPSCFGRPATTKGPISHVWKTFEDFYGLSCMQSYTTARGSHCHWFLAQIQGENQQQGSLSHPYQSRRLIRKDLSKAKRKSPIAEKQVSSIFLRAT